MKGKASQVWSCPLPAGVGMAYGWQLLASVSLWPQGMKKQEETVIKPFDHSSIHHLHSVWHATPILSLAAWKRRV
jgi:hypothetical protein